MFWNRDKTVKVKLVTPVTFDVQQPPSQPSTAQDTAVSQGSTTNTDLALKLLALGGIALPPALVAYGYSRMVGYYEQFGIDINEITLNTPTLLLWGYVNILDSVLGAATSYPIIVPSLAALLFVILAAAFMKVINNRLKTNVIVGAATWIGMSMFLAFVIPAISLNSGADAGRRDFKKFTSVDASYGLDSVQTVITEKGLSLTGHLILADSNSTFLLVDQTVFKIDDKSGRIIRQAALQTRKPPNK